MKTTLKIIPPLLCGLWFSNLCAQETAEKWTVEIPELITDATPSEPPRTKADPVDYNVKSSRTTRRHVTEAPPMAGLPPVTGTINVTVQVVEDPNLPDPVPVLPALPPDDPAVIARFEEFSEKYRGTELVFLSATVFDHNRTLLRIFPNGKVENEIKAWSNLDFNHFCGFSNYRVTNDEDGSFYECSIMMGIGNETTDHDPESPLQRVGLEIPKLPDFVEGGPAFILVEGKADSPAMNTLEQIHDLYRVEGVRMEQAYHAREKAHAERKAYLLANPPVPEDVTVRFWKRETQSPAGVENLKEGVRP